MTLFEYIAICVFNLFVLIIISFIVLVILLIDSVLNKRKRNKKVFDREYPIGFTFSTKLKQRFPYGKWKLLGKDQNNCYLYERIK